MKYLVLLTLGLCFANVSPALAKNSKRPAVCYKNPASTKCHQAELDQYRRAHKVSKSQCKKHPGLPGCSPPNDKKAKSRKKKEVSKWHSQLSKRCKNELEAVRNEYKLKRAFIHKAINSCVEKTKHRDLQNILSIGKSDQAKKSVSAMLMSCMSRKKISCGSNNILSVKSRLKSCKVPTKEVTSSFKMALALSSQNNCKSEVKEGKSAQAWSIFH